MESATATRTTHLASDRTRPGLALVLALLSLPGSTVTWYVIPLGGLLIGLPLALAAIVLATRARRERGDAGRARMAAAAMAIAALAIVQMTVYYLVESLA
jgi:hypothetical protein